MDSISGRQDARLTIREYVAADGTTPFRDWLATLDVQTRARVQARVLLLGGSKSSQRGDVRRARQLWRDYLEVNAHGKTK